MRIQSIQKARKGGRYVISFDEGKDLLLSKEVLIDFGLRRNDEIAEETLDKIQDAQLFRDAYFVAGRLLNYRMRTRTELDQRLRKKGYSHEIVERVIGKLGQLGLIDDSRFAEAFVATKIASKPVGRRELERGLREKGVAKETVEKAISLVRDDDTQLSLALAAAESRMRSLKRFDSAKRREKLAAFLARRGFDWDIIKKVTRRVFKGDIDAVDL
jgi:regulatory protein